MVIIGFLTQLFGATMLLLFAVRMVRTGIERAFGASFRRALTGDRNPVKLAAIGVVLAVILQSSAAVTVLAAGFAGSGILGFAPGMAIVLGGDLGSALLIQVLSLKLDWLVPVLLTVGGLLFLKTERRGLKQAGRIILGVAFILIALQFLRETVEPIKDSGVLPALSAYFQRDFITAFLAGAALAFVMHSSVAVILMCVTIISIGALPVMVGASLVLGANLGSAIIPLWLTRGTDPQARHIPLANLILRGSAAFLCVLAVNWLDLLEPVIAAGRFGDGQLLVFLHIGFNMLLLLALPFLRLLEAPVAALLPAPVADPEEEPASHRSVLDDTLLDNPQQALACLRREVLRMADLVGQNLTPVMELYRTFDKPRARRLQARDEVVNAALDEVRRYAAAMPQDGLTRPQRKELRALVDYAIALEAAGDIVVKRLLPLAQEKSAGQLRFSTAGRAELETIHERVLANLAKATNVLVSNDVESARLLLEDKAEMGRLERKSRKRHLARLSDGDQNSFASSDIHLETAYSLKEFNSWIVQVAHPILVREGQLLETRLIRDLDKDSSDA